MTTTTPRDMGQSQDLLCPLPSILTSLIWDTKHQAIDLSTPPDLFLSLVSCHLSIGKMLSSSRSAAALALRGKLNCAPNEHSPPLPHNLISISSQASIVLNPLPINCSDIIFILEICERSCPRECSRECRDATTLEHYRQGEAGGAIA